MIAGQLQIAYNLASEVFIERRVHESQSRHSSSVATQSLNSAEQHRHVNLWACEAVPTLIYKSYSSIQLYNEGILKKHKIELIGISLPLCDSLAKYHFHELRIVGLKRFERTQGYLLTV